MFSMFSSYLLMWLYIVFLLSFFIQIIPLVFIFDWFTLPAVIFGALNSFLLGVSQGCVFKAVLKTYNSLLLQIVTWMESCLIGTLIYHIFLHLSNTIRTMLDGVNKLNNHHLIKSYN